LPLPHVLERIFICAMLYSGASIGFYSGDVQKLKNDLVVLKPTVFVSVPRLYNRFYDAIKSGIDQLTGVKALIAGTGLKQKLKQNQGNNQT